MSEAVEIDAESPAPKKLTPRQKQAAWAIAILATLGTGVAGLRDTWAVVEPAVTEFTGYARQKDVAEIKGQIDTLRREMPRKTYECIRSKGRDCE